MTNKRATNLLAVVLGCSMLAAGTTVSFAAANSSEPSPSDVQITHQVMNKLTHEMPNSFVGLTVATQDGVVTLSGRADTAVAKLRAQQTAQRVPGVTDVKDHLRINR